MPVGWDNECENKEYMNAAKAGFMPPEEIAEKFPFEEYEVKYLRGLQVIGTKSDLEKAMASDYIQTGPLREELRIAKMNRQTQEQAQKKA